MVTHESAEPWLMLVYKLPRQPSRLRVNLWRKIKKMGLLYLQDSVCIAPSSGQWEEQLRWLSAEIVEVGGTATIWRCAGDTSTQDRDIIAAFRAERQKDYAALLARIRAEMSRMEKQPFDRDRDRNNLGLLRRAYQFARNKDFFNPTGSSEVEKALDELQGRLDRLEASS